MKKKWIIIAIGVISCCTYILGYYSARKDHLLVRRIHFGNAEAGAIQSTVSIEPGNFGPGKGGVLASPDEIMFCYFVFTPLRFLEAKYRNKKSIEPGNAAYPEPATRF